MKRCSACGEFKPASDFYARRGACKSCHSADCRDRRERTPPTERVCADCGEMKPTGRYIRCMDCRKARDATRERTCKVCGETKPGDAFSMGILLCKACRSEHQQASSAAYRLKNAVHERRRGRRKSRRQRGITDLDWCEVLDHDPCAYCGERGGQVDHIDADLSQGTWENLTAACPTCNNSKNRKPLLRFLLEGCALREALAA